MAGRYLKKKSVFLIVFAIALALIPNVYSSTSSNFNLYTKTLGIQMGYALTGQSDWLLLEAQNNYINSSTNTLLLTNTGNGYFTFSSNETFNLELSFSDLVISLEGDSGNSKRQIQNETSYSVVASNVVTVYWNTIVQPFLPYMFILGMIGLVAMFGGPILAIKMMKDNPRWALTQGIMFTTLGFGLFIAWLGSP